MCVLDTKPSKAVSIIETDMNVSTYTSLFCSLKLKSQIPRGAEMF